MNLTTSRGSGRQCRTWLPLLACLAVSLPAFAQGVSLPAATDLRSHGVTPDQIESLSRILNRAVQKKQVAGCSFLVAHQGEVVFRKAVGYADLESKRPFTTDGATTRGDGQAQAAAVAPKWKTTGLQQANSMGGGAATVPKSGKFRVFVLMGQSNMTGAARAKQLKPPYNQKHDRIRIWANGRWEYYVPRVRFGPGVTMAHQLAELWPNDTISIIKVASGGTGIRGFEKEWSKERANRTFDGKKGSLYKDLMNAVAEAKRISKPEFSGFVWKQGAADGTRKDLAEQYYDTLKLLISDLRTDLGVPKLPVFLLSYMSDEKLLKAVLPHLSDEELRRIRNPVGKPAVKRADLLEAVLSYLYDTNSPILRKTSGRRPYITRVIAAQNRAGRELLNVATIYPGELPRIGGGNNHINAEGQIKLGKVAARAVEEFYKAKK